MLFKPSVQAYIHNCKYYVYIEKRETERAAKISRNEESENQFAPSMQRYSTRQKSMNTKCGCMQSLLRKLIHRFPEITVTLDPHQKIYH